MTSGTWTAVLAVGFCALNLFLLAACLIVLRRTRRRMKRAFKAERTARRQISSAVKNIRLALRENNAAHDRRFNRSIWPQIESLISLYRLLDGKIELPSMRRWAASPDFLMHIVGHIRRHEPKRIVECGSGTSTIVMAHMLNSLGRGGHIYAIEDHAPTIQTVREQLRRHNLEHFVTLVVAPLVEKRYDGFDTVFHWYDLGPNAIPADIDLLIVDGPHSMVNPSARYPAGPELLPKLSRDAHIFVDDANRREEKGMLHLWRKFYPDLGIRELAAEKGCSELFFLDRKVEEYLPAEWQANEQAPASPRP